MVGTKVTDPCRSRSPSTAMRSSGTVRTTAGRGGDGWDALCGSVMFDWRKMALPRLGAGYADPDLLRSPMRGTGHDAVIGLEI